MPAAFLRPDTCANCRWSTLSADEFQCRFNPPQVTAFASAQQDADGTIRGLVMLGKVSAFPVVQPDQWCSRHQRGKVLISDEAGNA
jgi:hypothetical protein